MSPTEARWVLESRKWIPPFSFALGGLLVLNEISQYAVSPLYAVFARDHYQAFADAWHLYGMTQWYLWIATSTLLAILLLVHAVRARRLPAPLPLITAGLVLFWTGYLVIRLVGQLIPPGSIAAGVFFSLTSTAITLTAAALLIIGGIRLRQRR